ncbi:MAG: hypothetical protein KGY41_08160 [Desulfovermiculus sp.]|nr:hypothetical protein [Desulfovermiculus sp.]
MLTKKDLLPLVSEALDAHGGSARIPVVCKYVWDNYESELRQSGELFYTWQSDIRWAANFLRKKRVLKSARHTGPGIWMLNKNKES